MNRQQVIDLLDRAGLAGRGGAGFSTARKLAASTWATPLIVNACDGELGALKDQFVITEHLDEVVYVAERMSQEVSFAAHRGSVTHELLRQAQLPVLEVPDRYVSSEETALISLAAGGLAKPAHKSAPAVLGSRGAHGRALPPTLVLNAETLWRTAQILEHGPGWFRSIGTVEQPGPRLISVTGAVTRPGVYDGYAGMPLPALLHGAGADPVGAVNVGGLAGGWLTARQAVETEWSDRALLSYGARTGSGTVMVLSSSRCPVDYLAEVTAYAAAETAGQCGPCMFGVPAVAQAVTQLADGTLANPAFGQLQRRITQLPGRGACRFPDGVAAYLRSALTAFGDEVGLHLAGRCRQTESRQGATGAREPDYVAH